MNTHIIAAGGALERVFDIRWAWLLIQLLQSCINVGKLLRAFETGNCFLICHVGLLIASWED